MAANIETMFYVRETPWHGLGTRVLTAPATKEALEVAGLNWKVIQEPVYTEANELIEGYKANVRDSDRKVLGVVTTVTKSSRMKKPSVLQTVCLVKVYVTRQQVPCREGKRYGSLPECHRITSSQGKGSVRIWYFPIPMTAPVRLR